MTKISIDDLHSNPFRDLERLPTKPEKVAILKQSIKDTSFWDNIVVRKAANGSYEIAYGHNRLEALRQLNKSTGAYSHVDLPVRDLDDTMMAKMMARENHEEWGAYAEVDAECARAVIAAFGAGKITLPKTKGKVGRGGVRVAPEFAPSMDFSSRDEKVYTASTLADFLGWSEVKTESILQLLSFQSTDAGKAIDFQNLSPRQARAVITQTKRVERDTKDTKAAVSIGKQLANEMRSSSGNPRGRGTADKRSVSIHTAKYRTNELMRAAKVKIHTDKQKAKKDKLDLQKEDRQVAIFLDACKAYESAIRNVTKAVSKFSPEAKAFTIRRLGLIAAAQSELKGALK